MRIKISSVLKADASWIWMKLGDIETLRIISRPYASFRQISGEAEFHEGGDYAFKLRVFGVLPLGVHHIHIDKWSREDSKICSRECNKHVPVWNHTIELSEPGDASTRYTDTVELEAGWKTPFVRLWAYLFYRHRQRKWRRLIIKAR